MRKMLRRIHYLLNRRRMEDDLREEMLAHVEMMPADRRLAFGSPSRLQDEIRDVWRWHWLDDLRQDFVHGLRGFIRDRRLTVSALAAITVAVGAATAVFSVVDRSLFRALPYRDGERLVTVGLVLPSWGPAGVMFAGAYRDWLTTQQAVELTSWSGVTACDFGGESPQRIHCARAESTFLPTLGIQPLIGRVFTEEEDRPGSEPVALLSFGLWQTTFGGASDVLGKRIRLDGVSTRVIGVLPRSFETPDLSSAEVLIPQKLAKERTRNVEVKVIGRLKTGYTAESAAAALEPLFQVFRADFGVRVGDNFAKTMRLRVTRLRDEQVQQHRLALWLLLGAVTAFVLIACANVGNLLLARCTVRRQEFAIRTALGASRRRLVRQMLTESALLAAAGGLAGCALAWGLLRVAIHLAPESLLRLRDAALDARVLTFSLALSAAAALLFGLGPSLDRLSTEMLGGDRSVRSRRPWIGQALIAGQMSASLLLLTIAGLLLMSLWRLQNAPLGFERERVVTASFTLPQYRYGDERRQLSFFRQLEEQLSRLPGTVAAAITDSLPPGGNTRRAPLGNKTEITGSIRWRYVTPGYFEALGIPIKYGRPFTETDRGPGDLPVILSESLSTAKYGQADPTGGRIGAQWPRTVVGVAGDVRNSGLAKAPEPEFYILRRYSRAEVPGDSDPSWWRRGTAIVRTTLRQDAALAMVRAVMQQIDPDLPVSLEPMDSQVDRLLTQPRFQTALLALFAVTGVVLAGIGLYGLLSFLMAERTREIGIRMALGATRGSVVRMVLVDAARWTGAGIIAGMVASAGLLPVLQSLLFDVRAFDVRAFAVAAIVLAGVALLASWLPARRASSIEPMSALRSE